MNRPLLHQNFDWARTSNRPVDLLSVEDAQLIRHALLQTSIQAQNVVASEDVSADMKRIATETLNRAADLRWRMKFLIMELRKEDLGEVLPAQQVTK